MTAPGPDFASQVIRLVGGARNIATLTHCMARLRFVLHDDSLADDEALQALPEVVVVVRQGGQVQLALTFPVPTAHKEIARHLEPDRNTP
ncbi:PTS transporter subunit EIIB [Streptomyces sp. NBC_00481]|uniref:PTS transporter subunit EIIB n=1 Tax=unclassified Streptomyces TaxID=2593676 RepID=UPI002DD8611D|nr:MULTISPECIES: PTS transporter subunit EIIB [unclassified Streptomyces]WRY98364.1 PTS transporter subunit EIIB [Streptomyces sp. NBC_00481]